MEKAKQTARQYCRYYILNECMFGQEYEQILEMMEEMNVKLDVDFTNCTVLLTGIAKRFYTSRLHIRRRQYFQISNALRAYLDELQETLHFQYELVTVNYDSSKLMSVVFTFKQPFDQLKELALSITQFVQKQFENYGLNETPYLRNHSILSNPIHSFDEFQRTFERMLKQHRLGFFSMETPLEIEQENTMKGETLTFEEPLTQLEEALAAKDEKRVELLLDGMLLTIKKQRSIVGCYEMLMGIRKILLTLNDIYSCNLEKQIEKSIQAQAYCSIEEMREGCLLLLKQFSAFNVNPGEPIHPLTLKAIQYLKKHVSESVGLNEVAYHLQVTPAYLSRLVNKDLGISIPNYMNNLRMEQAKKLLVDSSLKIHEIARQVGIRNVQYFCVQFKKATSLRPQEYRRMYQLDERYDSTQSFDD